MIRVRTHIASAIDDILTQNAPLTPTVVASLTNNSRPVTAFNANPSHMIEKNFSRGLRGNEGGYTEDPQIHDNGGANDQSKTDGMQYEHHWKGPHCGR